MSLPLALGTRLETIPASTPYLHVDAVRAATWAQRLAGQPSDTAGTGGPRLRVGLAWSGNQRQPNDQNRSMALAELRALTDLDADFVAVQNEVRATDQEERVRQGIRYFGPELQDFADTAALVSNLDLVISVDSAPAHLAGALGLPVWILLCWAPDWRWLIERDDSPWYPSARLFRQSAARNWESVLVQVRLHLESLLAQRRGAPPGATPRTS
jgi:hypothetical protein